MIHVDKVSPVKKAGTNAVAGAASISEANRSISKNGINQLAQNTGMAIGIGFPYSPTRSGPGGPRQSPLSGQAVSYLLTRSPLRDAALMEQITSNTFIQLTFFFVVSSFWANFIIGKRHSSFIHFPLYVMHEHLKPRP